MLEEELAEVQTDINNATQRADEFSAEQSTLQRRMELATRICSSDYHDHNIFSQTKGENAIHQF